MRTIFTIALLITFIYNGISQNTGSPNDHPSVHKFTVKEVLQTTSYTYLLADENGREQWLAMPKIEAAVGETYYYHGGMEMPDFTSKELNRTFASVMFLNGVVDPEVVEGGNTASDGTPQKAAAREKPGADITPASGGITIAELFNSKAKYGNKVVKIRGKVTKFSSSIMGRNWVHLQDATSSSGGFDFTATTADEVKVGDVVTIEGIITLDKDFGAGYFYEVIMENGKVVE